MMMTLTTLEETLTSLATTATDSSVCSCTVCGEGTKPQKSAATFNDDRDCEDSDDNTYEIYV